MLFNSISLEKEKLNLLKKEKDKVRLLKVLIFSSNQGFGTDLNVFSIKQTYKFGSKLDK